MTALEKDTRLVMIPRTVTRGRPRGNERAFRLSGLTMGTSWSAQFYAAADRDEKHIGQQIVRVLDGVVQEMSTWLPSSDISRFNSSDPGTWHELKPCFHTVLTAALDLADRTNGAYDPTIGALVQLWGFGSEGARSSPPDAQAVGQVRDRSGWRRLEIDHERARVRQPGGLQLDLSSIAKGFGVDAVARCLECEGITSYLCEIGGELRGAGVKPDGQPWWVALESPPGDGIGETLIALHGLSVATSGDYVRSYAQGGRTYGHTLDPRTGYPLEQAVSVSVIAQDCMTADALATALSVLGAAEGLGFANRNGIVARFISGPEDACVFSDAANSLLS